MLLLEKKKKKKATESVTFIHLISKKKTEIRILCILESIIDYKKYPIHKIDANCESVKHF